MGNSLLSSEAPDPYYQKEAMVLRWHAALQSDLATALSPHAASRLHAEGIDSIVFTKHASLTSRLALTAGCPVGLSFGRVCSA